MNMTGYWYNPDHVGCGLNVMEAGGVVGVTWFGHTLDGRQIWLYGTGTRSEKGHLDAKLLKADGGGFPSAGVSNNDAGRILLTEDGESLVAEISVLHSALQQVDFSPRPPAGHTQTVRMRLQRLL